MKLEWLKRTMQDGDEPSSKRLVFVVGLLIVAPAALFVALFKLASGWPECFLAYVVSVGGSYAVSRFAEKPPLDKSSDGS